MDNVLTASVGAMWIRNKRGKANPLVACLLSTLMLLPLLLLHHVCLSDALKSVTDIPAMGSSSSSSTLSAAVSSDFEQLIETKLNESAASAASGISQTQELLSRKRRYLVFPEGSSFQMVFDEIICVVDYTNYLVLGITVALAWELPSKPPSEALEDLLTKLEDGTIDISRNDTVSNITYVDDATAKPSTQTNQNSNSYKPNYINLSSGAGSYNSYYSSSPVFRTPMHPTYQYENSYYRRPSVPARRKDNYYYTHKKSPESSYRNPFKQWSETYTPAQNSRYPYWALPSHFKTYQRQRNSYYKKPSNRRQQKIHYSQARHHKIYPVFGKRSLPDAADPHRRQRRSGTSAEHDRHLSNLEGIQIKYHRNSRQTLYERIEKYLDKRGQNGHQCVLRTLCETGQKSQDREPGSFVGELLRAVFTIPEALEHEQVAYKDTRYDKAHAHVGDCAELYPECKQSIWDAPFIQ